MQNMREHAHTDTCASFCGSVTLPSFLQSSTLWYYRPCSFLPIWNIPFFPLLSLNPLSKPQLSGSSLGSLSGSQAREFSFFLPSWVFSTSAICFSPSNPVLLRSVSLPAHPIKRKQHPRACTLLASPRDEGHAFVSST